MSRIPNFANIAFEKTPAPNPPAAPSLGSRPKASSVKPELQRSRPRGHRFPRDLAGHRALSARPLPHDVCQPALDHPAICRVLHGGRFQRVLPPQSRRRAKGPLGRVRSRHPPRLRFRSPARLRRRRHGRRRDRLDLRHAHAVLGDSARPDERVDDHERRGAADPGAVRRGCRGTGRAAGKTLRHHSERHSERVHGAQHLHLSAGALDADHLRHFCVHLAEDAEIQLDLDLRLSHAGGRRDAGPRARLYAGRRRRISARRARGRSRRRPLRAAAVVLLGDRHELLHGSRQDARGAAVVGQAADTVQSEGPALAEPAHALPDFGLVADRAGRLQQRDAHHHRGDGGNPGPYPIAAHQRARRGAGAADRFLRPDRAQHPTVPAAGKRHQPHHRSLGRLVLCRAADPRSRRESLGPYPGSRSARRHGKGDRGRRAQAADRGSLRQDASQDRRRQAGGDRRQQIQAGQRSADRRAEGGKLHRAAAADRQAVAAAERNATRRTSTTRWRR